MEISETQKGPMPMLEDGMHQFLPPEFGFVVRTEMIKNARFGEGVWDVLQEVWADGQLFTVRDRIPNLVSYPILELALEKMKRDILRAFRQTGRCQVCGRTDGSNQ